jgi:hypothetical protein
MESKQTAVEWLVNRWKKLQSEQEKMTWNQIIQITELAKEMERQQIIDAWHRAQNGYNCNSGEDYYTQTFTEPKND